MSVYSRIDSVRKGITWKYINDHVDGAYHGRMTDLKHNKTTLSDVQIQSVANILGTTTDYLLGKTDDPTPPGQKESPPRDGEHIGPNKRALLDLVEDMSEDEMGALLELVKAAKQMRRQSK